MHHKEITIAVFIVRDEKGRTPYAVAGDKETRNEFRRFMACHPDRYDYVKAQVCFAKSPVSSVILLLYHERGKSTHETVKLTWLPKLILANRRTDSLWHLLFQHFDRFETLHFRSRGEQLCK